jgi:ribonuclease HI
MTITLHTDGGSRPLAGVSGYAAVLTGDDGRTIAELAGTCPLTGAHAAEYLALIAGLTTAVAQGHTHLDARLDCAGVVAQMTGDAAVRSRSLRPLHALAVELAGRFDAITFALVYRSANARAHHLTTSAIVGASRENLSGTNKETA